MKEVPAQKTLRTAHGYLTVKVNPEGTIYVEADRALVLQPHMLDLREDLIELQKWTEENADLLPVEV